MKVAFAVGTLRPTGIVRVVRNIAVALAQDNDISVSIICAGRDEAFQNYIPGNIDVYDLNIDRYGRRKKYLKYIGALRALFSCYTPDVLVVSGMEHVIFYDLASRILPHTRRIAWEHRNFTAGPKFRLEWLGKRLAAEKWDGVLCITKKDYEQYRAFQGSDKKLYQIYNLTDFSCVRKDYNDESTRIMSCGYLSHIKGFDMLIQVAQRVLTQKPDWSWDIYGEGQWRDYLEQMIHEYGMENRVRLMGYVDNVQEVYGEYSFFVLTSRAEGMGMVLIEAQKAGLPVISFDIKCGPSDVVEDGKNGFLVQAFDLDAMADRILTMIDDAEKRQRFSNNSEMNHAEFDKTVIVEKWKEMLGLTS